MCGEDLKKVAYFKGKKYHPECYEKEKWLATHFTLEELKEIARKRVEKINGKKLSKLREVM